MERIGRQHYLRVAAVALVFSAGYLCGTLSHHSDAHAQFGEVGGDLLKRAEKSGGPVGSIAQLGSAITDMEKNVNGLQKNLDMLKKVKAALGGK